MYLYDSSWINIYMWSEVGAKVYFFKVIPVPLKDVFPPFE